MRAMAHALASLAAASLVPGVVESSQRGDALPWLAAAVAGVLPDVLERLSLALARADVLYTPDPLVRVADNEREAGRAVAETACLALATGRMTSLRLRPLPSSCGAFSVRVRRDALPSGMPAFPPVWPAEVEVRVPDGAQMAFHPAPNGRCLARIDVRDACGRGRGRAHSALLLLGGAAALVAWGVPAGVAAGAALFTHAVLDAMGTQGIPLWRRGGRVLAARRWRDEDVRVWRAVAGVSVGTLGVALALGTAFVAHPRRVVAAALVVAAGLFAAAMRGSATVRTKRSSSSGQ